MSQESLAMRDLVPAPFDAVQDAMRDRIPSYLPEQCRADEANKLASPLLDGLNNVLGRWRDGTQDAPPAEQELFLRDLTDIAAYGILRGHSLVEEDFPAERAWNDFTYRRQALLGIYACNPGLAIEIAKRRIVGLHGSVSGTLLPVLRQGLRPLAQLRQNQTLVVSGERGPHVSANVMASVSFMQLHEIASRQARSYLELDRGPLTDDRLLEEIGRLAARIRKESTESRAEGWDYWWRDVDRATLQEKMRLREYLLAPPLSDEDAINKDLVKQSFPVVWMIDDSEIQAKPELEISGFRKPNDRVKLVSSSIKTEFAVIGGVTSNAVRVVLVPNEHIGTVQELASRSGADMVVAPLKDIPCLDVDQ